MTTEQKLLDCVTNGVELNRV